MSDFNTPPPFGVGTLPVEAMLGQIQVTTRARGTSKSYTTFPPSFEPYGPSDEYDTSAVPWGFAVGSAYTNGSAASPTAESIAELQQAVANAQNYLVVRQGELDAALADVATATEEQTLAEALYLEIKGEVEAANFEVVKTTLGVQTIDRRRTASPPTATEEDADAAGAAYAAAQAAAGALSGDYYDRELAWEYATAYVPFAYGAVTLAQTNLANAQTSLTKAQFDLAYLPGGGSVESPAQVLEGGYFASLASNTFGPEDYHVDANGCRLGTVYYGSATSSDYQHVLRLPAAVFEAASAQKLTALTLAWHEVRTSNPTVTVTFTPPHVDPPLVNCPPFQIVSTSRDGQIAFEPVVTYAEQTEAFDLTGATIQPDGWYVLEGEVHHLSAPDCGGPTTPPAAVVTTRLEGPISKPSRPVLVTPQYIGAEARRGGFPEYLTPSSQAQVNRYLYLGASNTPATPVGKSYTGSLEVVPPAFDVDAHVLDPGGYENTLSPDAQSTGAPYYPDSLTPVTQDATIQTDTARVMSNPAGMELTLSGAQGPGGISTAVEAATESWDTGEHDIRGNGAMDYTAPTGDFRRRQRMRFKLRYTADYQGHLRTTTFSQTWKWEYHRRNLLTGETSVEPQSTTLEFPIVTPAPDPTPENPHPQPTYSYAFTDADWTELPCDPDEAVSLVLVPGELSVPGWTGFDPLTVANCGKLALGNDHGDSAITPLG